MIRRCVLALGLLSVLEGCNSAPAVDQIVMYVDTDAPVPRRSASDADPPPLFDRVRVDLYRAGEEQPCDGCSREFALTRESMADAGVSFGILPPPAGSVLRIRMYPAWAVVEAEPLADASLETYLALPDSIEGRRELNVFLGVDSLGKPGPTRNAPATPSEGPLAGSQVGTWAKAQRTTCASDPRADEVCVPGGAFWMASEVHALRNVFGSRPHLVVLNPFYLQKSEVTVGEWKAHGGATPVPWSGSTAGVTYTDYCVFRADSPANDALALNCIGWASARAYCQSRGGDLPTEAQLEYVESGFRSSPWCWGTELPHCEDMVYGLAGYGYLSFPAPCNASLQFNGPKTAGSGARDRLEVGGRLLTDLNGNLAEWALDAFRPMDDPLCWPAGVLLNPVCTAALFFDPSARGAALQVQKGGSWPFLPLEGAAQTRGSGTNATLDTGVRCARPATPSP